MEGDFRSFPVQRTLGPVSEKPNDFSNRELLSISQLQLGQ